MDISINRIQVIIDFIGFVENFDRRFQYQIKVETEETEIY